jgi:hypothetical protein
VSGFTIEAVFGAIGVAGRTAIESTDAEAVSTSAKRGSDVEVAGPETKDAVTDIESIAAPERYESVTTAEVAVEVSAVV